MKKCTFEIIVHEESDSWWEGNPSDHDVRQLVIDQLENGGIYDVTDVSKDHHGNCEVTLRKFENPANER